MILKPLFIILFSVFIINTANAQLPFIGTNTTENERATSILYKNFADKYDFLIAYTMDSYWWSNLRDYSLLAFKDGICLKGSFYSKKNKHDVWSKPKIKFKEVDCDSAKYILKYLNNQHFYSLNRDSLNINRKKINDKQDEVFSYADGINYKFEILTKADFLIIESYMPEYFLQKIPELKAMETFIKCRDLFFSKYKKL